MSQQALEDMRLPPVRSQAGVVVFVLASLALHGVGLLALSWMKERPALAVNKPVELVMIEVQKPPPPPPEPPKEEPKPKPPPPKVKPPPIKVAVAEKPPPPPPEQAPPPPNEPPPEPPPKPVPLVVGISMSSTTNAGNFAAPVGNTTYGKVAERAVNPQEVKPYAAPKYAPIYQVDREPQVASEVKIPYPEEARRAGVEGTVTLSITIDAEGRVVAAKIVSGPGYGLDEAAREAIRRFRFKPAIKGGEAVSTEMKYSYTFLLD
jgi:protein TonB